MMRRFFITSLLFTVMLAAGCGGRTTGVEMARDEAGTASNGNGTAAANAPAPVRVSAEGTDAAEPALATAANGTAYVLWVEHLADGGADLWLARLGADGQQQDAPAAARVNPQAGEATAWRGDAPTIAVAPDNTIYVGWTARDRSSTAAKSSSHANTLYLSASRDGGRSFAPPAKVNDDARPAAHGMHSLAVASDGRVHLAWLDERNLAAPSPPAAKGKDKHAAHQMEESNREVFTAHSTDGGRTFSRNTLVARDACPCCKTSVATGADGRAYISWRQVLAGDYRHIAVAASADGGEKFAAPVVVSDDRWLIRGCPVSGAALAVGRTDGVVRVVWYTAGEAGAPGLYWTESRDNGQTFAPRRTLATGKAQGTPALTGDGATPLAVWEGRDGQTASLMSARLDGDSSTTRTLVRGGELPAAGAQDGRLFVAYISKNGERRGVRLLSADASAPRAAQSGE